MTSPEPVPDPPPPDASIVTTDGSTSSATVVTSQATAELAPPAELALPAEPVGELTAFAIKALTTPAITTTATAPPIHQRRRWRAPRLGGTSATDQRAPRLRVRNAGTTRHQCNSGRGR